MTFLDQITVLILTYNEAPNIGRTLSVLDDFTEIVVLDSNSSDDTAEIVTRYPAARLERRTFDNHACQWNHGLTDCGIDRPWVLALDADHILTPGLVREIEALSPPADVAGYRVGFNYCIYGRRLTASLYPPGVALYARERAIYRQAGHTQRVEIAGRVCELTHRIDHDDRKPLKRWFVSQLKYASLEADHLLSRQKVDLRFTDRMRLIAWPAPILVFLYTLLMKRCILDGLPGWHYVLQRTLAEALISLELVDRRLRNRWSAGSSKKGE